MTYEEALMILRDTPIDIRSSREDDIHSLYAEASLLSYKAQEKQIPEKPIEREEGWLYWHCPSCGAEVGKNMEYKEHHCRCGQTLDWREEE